MENIVSISEKIIYNAIYEACFKANTYLPSDVLISLNNLKEIESASKINKINSNSFIAAKNQRPLCQDTGQIVVFVEIGNNVKLEKLPTTIINNAISSCYQDNFYRKSIVEDALFYRKNTQTNTPAIIYTDIVEGNEIKINLLVKGGGAENMSNIKMLTPSSTETDIFETITDIVKSSGQNACPPLFLGVGIGGTIDYAGILSKKAFFNTENKEFADKLKNYINANSQTKVADVKILTSSTHIACLPVAVTINCHSARHASVLINKNGYQILTEYSSTTKPEGDSDLIREINTENIEELKTLEKNTEVLLTGTIYTARDMAHKKIVEMINNNEPTPFKLENSIIFYAGPCPKKDDEQIGPIGPTTSKRMDKFAPILYDKGVLATIGKGERNQEVIASIKKNKSLYFSVQGGVASLLQNCIKSAKIIAFEDLGTEAIYKLEIEKLPVKLELK